MGQAHSSNNDQQYQLLSHTLDKQIEKEIALKNIQFEQIQAFRNAQQIESFSWEFLSSATTIITLFYAAQRTGNKLLAVPIVPVVMYIGYRYDQCYGQNGGRIKSTAQKILETESNLLKLCGSPITLKELDERRTAWENKCKTKT